MAVLPDGSVEGTGTPVVSEGSGVLLPVVLTQDYVPGLGSGAVGALELFTSTPALMGTLVVTTAVGNNVSESTMKSAGLKCSYCDVCKHGTHNKNIASGMIKRE